MRRAVVAWAGVALAVVAACSDFTDSTPGPTPSTNDGGTSGSSGTSGTSGSSGDGDAGCTPSQVAGDCMVNVCHPDGTTTSKVDDTDVPVAGECGVEKCENGKRVSASAADAGVACTDGLCDGKGVCSRKLGSACVGKEDCPSGFCVDGVCCSEACTGECKACNVAGAKGFCTNIPFLKEDTSYENAEGTKVDCTTAVGGARCNGAGKCLKTQGTACDSDDKCMGGKCSGGSKCLGAPGELCSAVGDCVSNQCAAGECK